MEMKRNEETEITTYALLNPTAMNCSTLKAFLLDFKPVDWWAIFNILSLGDALGMHTHNAIHFSYTEPLKVE